MEPSDVAPPQLTDLDRQILEFEAQTWKLRGAKEQAIRDEFKMRWVEYYRHLSKIIQTEAAEAHSPILIHRLRKLRDQTIIKKRR